MPEHCTTGKASSQTLKKYAFRVVKIFRQTHARRPILMTICGLGTTQAVLA